MKTTCDEKDKSIFSTRQRRTIIITTFTISIMLVVGSFFCPPVGDISPSVITAVGEILGFASVFTAIETQFGRFGLKRKDEEN